MKKQKVIWAERVQFNCRRVNPRNKKQWVVGVVVGADNKYMGAKLESSGDTAEEVFDEHAHAIVCTDVSLLEALLCTELAVQNHKFSRTKRCDCKKIP